MRKSGRKGQGLSVNMIILVALGLVILVIAVLMFSRSTREGQEASTNCALLGGACIQNSTAACGQESPYFGKCPVNQICCSKPPAQTPS